MLVSLRLAAEPPEPVPPIFVSGVAKPRRWPCVIASVILHTAVVVLFPFAAAMVDEQDIGRMGFTVRPLAVRVTDPAVMTRMQVALREYRALNAGGASLAPLSHAKARVSRPGEFKPRQMPAIRMLVVEPEGVAAVPPRLTEHAAAILPWSQMPAAPKPKALVLPPAGAGTPDRSPVMAGAPGIDLPLSTANALATAVAVAGVLARGGLEDLPAPPGSGPQGSGARADLPVLFALPPVVLIPETAAALAAAPSPALLPGRAHGRRMEHPPDGKFDMVVVQPSLPADIPEARGIMAGGPVYTVYLQVGDAKEWLLHYSAPDARTVQNGSVVTLGDPRPVSPPHPRVSLLPASLPATREKFVYVHGMMDENGVLRSLRVLGHGASESEVLLSALTEWQFRPARRGNEAAYIEVLFAIPVRQI